MIRRVMDAYCLISNLQWLQSQGCAVYWVMGAKAYS